MAFILGVIVGAAVVWFGKDWIKSNVSKVIK